MTKLKEIREIKGISQKQLAELSGVKFRNVQYYEQKYLNIDGAKIVTLYSLASALNCRISDIVESEELRAKLKAEDY